PVHSRHAPPPPVIYTLSLHDALPILMEGLRLGAYYVGNQIGNFGTSSSNFQPAGAPSILFHVYGPSGPSLNPATGRCPAVAGTGDRKSTRLNSSHRTISYAVFCLKKK